MADIENLLIRVWAHTSRSLVDEAWRCYNAGAIRASIAATWTAITADIIIKLDHLADDEETRAVSFRREVERAQGMGLTPNGVRAMQGIEAALLDTATEVEIIDAIDQRALERVREDRNLCVHPSLRSFDETYAPRPEVARAHLGVALDALLIHPPVQGRKILDRYFDFTCARFWDPSPNHIQSTYFDRVRSAARRNIVSIAAKHALLELDPDGRLDASVYADRSAEVLSAFALRQRGLVSDVVGGLRERFRQIAGSRQRRAIGRLGHEDFFWEMTDPSLVERLNGLVAESIDPQAPLGIHESRVISMVALESVRDRLPALTRQFDALSLHQQATVIEARPDRYFVPAVVRLMTKVRGYRNGEQVGELFVKLAPSLSLEELEAGLEAWVRNDQCCHASSMPGLAVDLYRITSHLGEKRDEVFRTFLARARSNNSHDDDYYDYPALAVALDSGGSNV